MRIYLNAQHHYVLFLISKTSENIQLFINTKITEQERDHIAPDRHFFI